MKSIILKKTVLGLSVMFLFVACETGYKGEYPTDNTSTDSSYNNTYNNQKSNKTDSSSASYNFNYSEKSLEPQLFEGGYLSDGLDITKIRQSRHGDMLRLVFDSNGEGDNGRVGSYSFVYSPDKYLIKATIGGYRNFSATLPKFSEDSIVEKIYLDKHLGDSEYKFNIKLREEAKLKVFNLENPARIVIDIKQL